MTPSASLRVWTGIFIAFVDAPTKYHKHTPKNTLQNCFNYLFFQNEQINDQKNQSKVVLNRKSKQPKKKKKRILQELAAKSFLALAKQSQKT